jgi:glycosyltransferase involved in cell wall biosynthesis
MSPGNGIPPLVGQRLLLLLPSLEMGGAERQALLLARHLAGSVGARVQVWGVTGGTAIAQLCEAHALPWRSTADLRWRWGWQLPPLLWGHERLFRRERFDALLPYGLTPNLLCGLLWRRSGARFCVWNQRDEGIGLSGALVPRYAIRQVSCVVANAENVACALNHKLGVPTDRIHVIANGVELARPARDRRAWRQQLDVDGEAFVAGMIANLHGCKDHATLLEAWRTVVEHLRAENRSAVLALAGRLGASYPALRRRVAELGIEPAVRFVGPVSDITGFLQACDLGVFSSRSEGSPNGLLECMAAGLAVVATDVPGIRAVVGASGEPYLVPPGNAPAFAGVVLALARNAHLRRRIAEALRQRCEVEFGAARMCRDYTDLLAEGMLGRRQPRTCAETP